LKIAAVLFALVIGAASSAAIDALAQPDVAAKPAAPVPPRPLGPELWRGARTGMAPEDVAALFPKAVPLTGEALAKGPKAGLKLPVELGGAPASAQFYFTTDGVLDSIIIDRPDVAAHKTDENLAKAHQVVDQLTTEHGQPRTCTEQRKLAALTCVWVLGDAKAIVSYRDIGGAAPALSVSYRKLNEIKAWSPGPVKKLKAR